MTVKPLAPLPMMAILDLGFGLALRHSAQLHGIGDDMVLRHWTESQQTCLSHAFDGFAEQAVVDAEDVGC